MNVLLVAYYYPPIRSGGTERPVAMKNYLPRFGHSISVLTHSYQKTCFHDPSEIRIYDVSHNNQRQGPYKLLWTCLRGWTELLNQFNRYASIFSMWKHLVIRHASHIIRQIRPDIILATYPPVETLEIGLYLSEQYNIPFVADFRDGLLFEPIERTRMKQHACIWRKYQQLERQIVRDASLILTASPPISDYFREHYQYQHVETIFNGFDAEEFQQVDPSYTLDKGKFHIVHTGRVGGSYAGRDIAPFMSVFRKLQQENPTASKPVQLHLVGQLTSKERLLMQDLLANDSIIEHGVLPKSQTLAFQRHADLLLVITDINRKSMITAKLMEYLGANRPVLALTANTYAETIVQTTGVGWIIHPHNEDAIYRLLKNVIMDASFYESLNPLTEEIAKYSRLRQMKRLSKILHGLTV